MNQRADIYSLGLFGEMKESVSARGFSVSDQSNGNDFPTFRYFLPGSQSVQEGVLRLDPSTRMATLSLVIRADLRSLHYHVTQRARFPNVLEDMPHETQIRGRRKKKPRTIRRHRTSSRMKSSFVG